MSLRGTFFLLSYQVQDLMKYYFGRKAIPLWIVALFSFFSIAAQESKKDDFPFYREDQIYFGASFMILESNQDRFKPQGLSRHFQFGLVRDIPLSSSGRFATGLGLGMGFERYTTNLIPLETSQYGLPEFNSQSEQPLFFSTQSLEIPWTLRWRNSTFSNYAFWRVYAGLTFQWYFDIKTKYGGEQLEMTEELQRFGTNVHLSFGYNTWNFYVAYRLQPFLDSEARGMDALPIQLTPIKIGLIFYLL